MVNNVVYLRVVLKCLGNQHNMTPRGCLAPQSCRKSSQAISRQSKDAADNLRLKRRLCEALLWN